MKWLRKSSDKQARARHKPGPFFAPKKRAGLPTGPQSKPLPELTSKDI